VYHTFVHIIEASGGCGRYILTERDYDAWYIRVSGGPLYGCLYDYMRASDQGICIFGDVMSVVVEWDVRFVQYLLRVAGISWGREIENLHCINITLRSLTTISNSYIE
jgi:hypothetical protein